MGKDAVELRVAAEAGIEGVLEQADLRMRVEAAEEFLQAEAVAVIGDRQAGLLLEEGAEIIGGDFHAARKLGLRELLVRIGQQAEDRLQLGMERGAILHRFGGEELVPQRKKRKVQSAVEHVGAGKGGGGGKEPVEPLEGGSGETAAEGVRGIAGGGRVPPPGLPEAREAGGPPFDDPHAHVG